MRPTHRLIEPLETRYAPAAFISISNAGNVDESDGTMATFTITISEAPAAGETITVHYVTENGTATQGADYVLTEGNLTFAEG